MNDYSLWIAVSGWSAWFAKEIISKLLGRRLARTGRFGVIQDRARIACDTQSKNAGLVSITYFPEMATYPQFSDCRSFRAEIECQMFNDTDTQIVYTQPEIDIWGVEGVRMIYQNAAVYILDEKSQSWVGAPAIAVPAHGIVRVRFRLPLAADIASVEQQIRETYEGTVALLRARTIDGKKVSLRICTSSFAGPHKVVWPDECRYPVYNLVSLNERGRRAGRRPQSRRPMAVVSASKANALTAGLPNPPLQPPSGADAHG